MKATLTLLGAALLAGALAVQAQTTPAPASAEQGRQRPTPEQREKMKEAFQAAREACKDAPDRKACMTQNMCAKAPDPAQCQARAKERQAHGSKRMDERQAMHEACTGKRGEELMKCLGEQRKARGHKDGPKKG
jgi:Spy/CpxP family protein refolding chaperone